MGTDHPDPAGNRPDYILGVTEKRAEYKQIGRALRKTNKNELHPKNFSLGVISIPGLFDEDLTWLYESLT